MKIKASTRLERLMNAYADRLGVDVNSLRWGGSWLEWSDWHL